MRAAVAALGLLCYVFAPITTHALRLGGLDGDEEGAIGHAFADRDYARLIDRNQDGSADVQAPTYLNTFIEHFSAQVAEPATYFHSKFRPAANETNVLAYAVTSIPAADIYRYLLSPENAGHVKIQPANENETIAFKSYRPSRRKSKENGTVVTSLKYASWQVTWRNVKMQLHATDWTENTYQRKSQTHISVYGLEDSGIGAPVYSALGSCFAVEDANNAVALFLREIGDFASRIGEAVLVFDQSTWMPDAELWKSVQKASWKDVILSEDMKKALKHEYDSFYASEQVYKDLDVPWKRGIIFLGPPGNGKTISLKALMKDAGVPILYVKTFHTYGGDELGIRMIFERARQEAPCLLIFEDLDSLITDNNRSFFLNEVDGLEDNDGLLMIGTTNHFEKLDSALSNRPSRFDRKYLFPNPSQAERFAYAEYWREKLKPNTRIVYKKALADTIAETTDGFSFAYLKEIFVSSLLLIAADETEELEFAPTIVRQIEILCKELNTTASMPARAEGSDRDHGATAAAPMRIQFPILRNVG